MHSPEWWEKRDTDAFLEQTGCYIVKSRSGQPDRNVDLFARNGAGECDCEHHRYRCMKPFEDRAQAPSCYHVKAAREQFMWDMIDRIMKETK